MTETIYSFYKRRTLIVKFVRLNLKITVKVATAGAILHNFALDWDDEVPVDPHPGLQPDPIPRPAQAQVNQTPPPHRRAVETTTVLWWTLLGLLENSTRLIEEELK